MSSPAEFWSGAHPDRPERDLGLIQCGFCNKMIDAMVSSSDAVAVAGALATPPEGDPPFEMAARW